MDKKNVTVSIGIITLLALGIIGTSDTQSANAGFFDDIIPGRKAPIAISGDNTYVVWWTNNTGNDEVMFRASADNGATFTDKINLSNTTGAESQDAEIAAQGDNVIISWWETNQTDDTAVMRVSNDNGVTFGPVLTLATNGTIGEAQEEGEEGYD